MQDKKINEPSKNLKEMRKTVLNFLGEKILEDNNIDDTLIKTGKINIANKPILENDATQAKKEIILQKDVDSIKKVIGEIDETTKKNGIIEEVSSNLKNPSIIETLPAAAGKILSTKKSARKNQHGNFALLLLNTARNSLLVLIILILIFFALILIF
ncbi:MAG: hypothetical protein V1770_02150 [bacterium]